MASVKVGVPIPRSLKEKNVIKILLEIIELFHAFLLLHGFY